jgi:hypothetical protein
MSKNKQKGTKKLRDIENWGPGCLCNSKINDKMFAYLLFCVSSLIFRALNAFSKSSFQIAFSSGPNIFFVTLGTIFGKAFAAATASFAFFSFPTRRTIFSIEFDEEIVSVEAKATGFVGFGGFGGATGFVDGPGSSLVGELFARELLRTACSGCLSL